jgi:hypothetical protein
MRIIIYRQKRRLRRAEKMLLFPVEQETIRDGVA